MGKTRIGYFTQSNIYSGISLSLSILFFHTSVNSRICPLLERSPPQKMDKKSRQKAEWSLTKCEKFLSIWTNGIRLFVFAQHKQSKQTKSRQHTGSSFDECYFPHKDKYYLACCVRTIYVIVYVIKIMLLSL